MRRVIDEIVADPERSTVQAALKACGQPTSAEIQAMLSPAKSSLVDPERTRPLVGAVWRECELELRRSNAFDLDDLLWFAVRLLGESIACARAGSAGGGRGCWSTSTRT
jgi:hypothetical protein